MDRCGQIAFLEEQAQLVYQLKLTKVTVCHPKDLGLPIVGQNPAIPASYKTCSFTGDCNHLQDRLIASILEQLCHLRAVPQPSFGSSFSLLALIPPVTISRNLFYPC